MVSDSSSGDSRVATCNILGSLENACHLAKTPYLVVAKSVRLTPPNQNRSESEIAELKVRKNREFDAMFGSGHAGPAPLLSGSKAEKARGAAASGAARRPRTWRCNKERYHHGSLAEAAIKRGLAVVAESGPMGVTMRGIARDCGVSAAGLVYYFHNRAGLRAAIANAAAEQMRPFSVFRSGGIRAAGVLRQSAQSWVDFAAKNPNLYRIVFGEGWRGDEPTTLPRRQCLHSIDRVANIGQMSGHIRDGDPRDHGWFLWSAMHGLAQACADGVATPAKAAPLIARFVAAIEGSRSPQRAR